MAYAVTLASADAAGERRGADKPPLRGFIVPAESADEAALVGQVPIYPAKTLLQVVEHLRSDAGEADARRIEVHQAMVRLTPPTYPDMFDVKGQLAARRALEIAAAGGHSALLVGPPGTGKTMLAQRFAGILPPMTTDEALESAAVLSLAGQFATQRWATRIYRSPHHTASAVALVGGGNPPMPGEISLAHHGVLFLDELPEFERRVLEALRQPLESGRITVSRAARQVEYPAKFQLIAAMNPCPCGYFGHRTIECRCTPDLVARYQDRISGPLLDRIDMRVEVSSFSEEELTRMGDGEPTRFVAERVRKAYHQALARQGKLNDHLAARRDRSGVRCHRRGQTALACGGGSARVVDARVPPRSESVSHHRRFGGRERARNVTRRRSDSISPFAARSLKPTPGPWDSRRHDRSFVNRHRKLGPFASNRVGPALHDGLVTRVEANAFFAIRVIITEQRPLPATERMKRHRHRNGHVNADHAGTHTAGKLAGGATVGCVTGDAVAKLVRVDHVECRGEIRHARDA